MRVQRLHPWWFYESADRICHKYLGCSAKGWSPRTRLSGTVRFATLFLPITIMHGRNGDLHFFCMTLYFSLSLLSVYSWEYWNLYFGLSQYLSQVSFVLVNSGGWGGSCCKSCLISVKTKLLMLVTLQGVFWPSSKRPTTWNELPSQLSNLSITKIFTVFCVVSPQNNPQTLLLKWMLSWVRLHLRASNWPKPELSVLGDFSLHSTPTLLSGSQYHGQWVPSARYGGERPNWCPFHSGSKLWYAVCMKKAHSLMQQSLSISWTSSLGCTG